MGALVSDDVRNTVRGILITAEREILMMQMAFPWCTGLVWILPGGGIEEGESPETALRREIIEETGHRNIRIIGEAWHQDFLVHARQTRLHQRFFMVHTSRFEPVPTDLSQAEMDWVRAFRWWPIKDLKESTEDFEPAEIGVEVEKLLEFGPVDPPRRLQPQNIGDVSA